jgi:hypothetical protein
MNRNVSILGPLLGFVLLSIACSFSVDLGQSSQTKIIDVRADQVWTSTGIEIEAGDLLTINYISGRWSPGLYEDVDALGYGGNPRSINNVIMGVSHAALIGRIGDHDPFFVGDHFHHTVGESGVLFLGINDKDLGNNSGTLAVEIQVTKKLLLGP